MFTVLSFRPINGLNNSNVGFVPESLWNGETTPLSLAFWAREKERRGKNYDCFSQLTI